MLAASVMIIAIARSASSQVCFRCRAGWWLSGPVAVGALNEPQTSRRSSGGGDGTTEAFSTTLKSIWHSLTTLQSSCHSFATRSACYCDWTATLFASTDASAHAATCLIHRCARRAPSAIAVVEAWSVHAHARVRDATSSIRPASCMQICCTTCSVASVQSARPLRHLFHQTTPRVGHVRSVIANCRCYDVCRRLRCLPLQTVPSPARCANLQSVAPADFRAPLRISPQAQKLLLSRGRHGHRPTVRLHHRAASSSAVRTAASCHSPHILTMWSPAT